MSLSATALVCCFARAYHHRHAESPVFSDPVAERLLSPDEYNAIARSFADGITFFDPDFQGTPEHALQRIVNGQLASSVLARSAFCERALADAVRIGCRQYVILASGCDNFACRCRDAHLHVFEMDLPEMISDKRSRMNAAGLQPENLHMLPCDLSQPDWHLPASEEGFHPELPVFVSMLGISYYLFPADFEALLRRLSAQLCEGSSFVFDYPTENESTGTRMHEALAAAAGEPMQARYSYQALETLLERCGLLIYEHLNADEMEQLFFGKAPDLHALQGVGYVLAVKKRTLA